MKLDCFKNMLTLVAVTVSVYSTPVCLTAMTKVILPHSPSHNFNQLDQLDLVK